MWKVLLSPEVSDFLNKQDQHIQILIKKRLERLKTVDPFHYLEHFEGQDFYKFRIGDYRALVDLDFEKKIIKVQVLDKRGCVYKGL